MDRCEPTSEVIDGWAEGISGSLVHEDRVVHVEHIWGTAMTINLAGTPVASRTRSPRSSGAAGSSPRSTGPSRRTSR